MVDYRSRRRRQKFSLQNFNSIFILSHLSRFLFLGFVLCIIFVFGLFVWYSRDLPTPGRLVSSKYADATRIYDKNGVLLYSVYQDQNRTYIRLSEIPKKLQQATIAIEDEDFYENQGFSIRGYIRAFGNILFFRRVQGGSTITQQLVKNVLLSSERNIARKIKEFILAIQVGKRYSKDQILEMYLNNISYGGASVGVEAASQTYFGKKAKDLDLSESAFLAGLPQSPTTYSPFSGNKFYIGRSEAVLRQMVANDYISKKEKDQALSKIKSFTFSQKNQSIKAPHFVMYVRKLLAKQFGEQVIETGGLTVTTTLDYELQKQAEKIVEGEIDGLKQYKVGNGAVLVTTPKTGEILTMVGSKDYFDTQNDGNFNAVFANRQPGSSLKPIIYAKAFEKGYTSSTVLLDVKTDFPTEEAENPIYTPENYSGKFSGPVQLRFALGNSINIPAVKLLALVGVKDTMQKGYDMGISNWEPTSENRKNVGLSLVLGGRETTLFDEVTAYGVFANGGIRQDLVAIKKVSDAKGQTLYEYKKREGPRALSEEVSFLISHILLDNNARIQEFGPNSYLKIPGKTVSVKTGTTDEKRDNWTVGYTPSVVVGVWVGNNDNSPMNKAIASGATGASSIWYKLMSTVVLKGKPDESAQKPANVIALEIDGFGGGLTYGGQSSRSEYFIKGTQPTVSSSIYKSKDGKDYFIFREDDPVSKDGFNRWQKGIDEWIEQYHKDDEKYHAPDEVLNPKKEEDKDEQAEQPTSTPVPTSAPSVTPTLITPSPTP